MTQYLKAQVCIADGPKYTAYIEEERFKRYGSVYPYFPLAVGKSIARELNGIESGMSKMEYDPACDRFIYADFGAMEMISFGAEDLDTNEGTQHLYEIGTYDWQWECFRLLSVDRPPKETKKKALPKPTGKKEQVFKKTIEKFIADEERSIKKSLGDLWDGPRYTMYSFHDRPDKLTFAYDGSLYEDLNGYYGWDFKERFDKALEDAGLEWGVDIDYDDYSRLSLYKPTSYNKKPFKATSVKMAMPKMKKTATRRK